jgi:hypothetical protein
VNDELSSLRVEKEVPLVVEVEEETFTTGGGY